MLLMQLRPLAVDTRMDMPCSEWSIEPRCGLPDEYAHRWRDMPKVVFPSTTAAVNWNTRLATGDTVTEITRLKAADGDFTNIGGAALAAMQAGLIYE
jgi:hypothetical protein